jgi:prepilin-type N-terminal cleavage/methylation domain-containing protein
MTSFTIIELMITLVISSVVISIAYYSYFLVNHQFNEYRRRSMEIKKYYLLSLVWQTDFERAGTIVDTIDDRHFIFYRGNTLVRYSIGDSVIVREEAGPALETPGQRDSFAMRIVRVNIGYLDDSTRLIREITLNTVINGDSVLLSGAKTYSAKEIMFAQITNHD